MAQVLTPESERDRIARYFEHLAMAQIGIIDLTGLPAHEMYAMVASWIRNRLDVEWEREVVANCPAAAELPGDSE